MTGLHEVFTTQARRHPGRPALVIGDRSWTYEEVHDAASRLAASIVDVAGGRPARVAVFGSRSFVSYTGTLGALLAGAAFVPLNPSFPVGRTRSMLERADVDAIVVDAAALPQLAAVLDGREIPILAPVHDRTDVAVPGRVIDATAIAASALTVDPIADADDHAYLLFTSGSTGVPKGVPITHANVCSFLRTNQARYVLTPEDRLTQCFDQTFDLSVFDMFMAWGAGASLCTPKPLQLLSPFRFVAENDITVWFSVPSVAALLRRKNLLRPGSLPSLRWSLFCGEALPMETAVAWQDAAPTSIVENLYGPTELTIACAAYRWDPERSPGECVNGTVPIGDPYDGLDAIVVTPDGVRRRTGEGELCIAGPQTFPGYWRASELTAEKVIVVERPGAEPARYYRTGDRVRVADGAPMVFLGRWDDQVQVLGHRVELSEVEAALRSCPEIVDAAAIAWPLHEGTAQGIVAFVTAAADAADAVIEQLRTRLPAYMVPSSVIVVDELPLNGNGKVDRGALRSQLAGEPVSA